MQVKDRRKIKMYSSLSSIQSVILDHILICQDLDCRQNSPLAEVRTLELDYLMLEGTDDWLSFLQIRILHCTSTLEQNKHLITVMMKINF